MSGSTRKLQFDDIWIREHFKGSETAALCRDYNKEHGTNYTKDLFNYYLKKYLGLKSRGRKYTKEEREWLKGYYPLYGAKKTADEFEVIFGRRINPDSLRNYCNRHLNANVSKQVRYGPFTSPVGSITVNCRGEARIKTETGWIKATHSQVEVPNGMVAFNLDRDIYNNKPENIGVTSNGVFRTLRNYGFWSDNREITKTGLLCCELEKLIKERSENSYD